jgi:formylglycine-generating enzyme required for sulfatase activity
VSSIRIFAPTVRNYGFAYVRCPMKQFPLIPFTLFIVVCLLGSANWVVAQSVSDGSVSGRRLALIMGNRDYQNVSPLKNPVNDANDMAVALQQLGFSVSKYLDTDFRAASAGVREFVDKIQPGDVVIFYYSGHGIGYNGKNYMIPVDASIQCIEHIEENGISIGRILNDFERKQARTSILFLDACRNVPSLKACQSNTKELKVQGLVTPLSPLGSMTIFATEEGTTADDNREGRNGLFTGELLKHLSQPGLGIRAIIDLTIAGVVTQTQGAQSPARYDKLWGDFILKAVPKRPNDPIPDPVTPPNPTSPVNRPAVTNFVAVKSGSFKMGAANRPYNEQPVHEVRLDGFLIGQYEVTVANWRKYCQTTQKAMPTVPSVDDPENYWNNKDQHPITNVSWTDAVAYANWMSEREGLQKAYIIHETSVEWNRGANGYRLPTEAEWEQAARAYTSDLPFAGSRVEYEVSWSQGNSEDRTHPVGSKKANGLGIFDLCGNVWEWCWDYYDEYYYRRADKTNPIGSEAGSMRSTRGGSWLTASNTLTVRRGRSPLTQSTEIGFRLVRSEIK